MKSISTSLSTSFSITIILFAWTCQVARASQAAGTETLVGIVGKDFVLLGADSSVSQSIALTASNLDKIAPLSDPFYYYTPEEEEGEEGESSYSDFIQKEQQKQRQQPCVVAAAAGDAAASDRLLGMLKAQATLEEYGNGLGCDVEYRNIDATASSDSNNNNNNSNGKNHMSSLSLPGLDVDAMANLARIQIAQALRSRTPFSVCLLIAGMSKGTTATGFVAQNVQRQLRNAWSAKEVVVQDGGGETAVAVSVETEKEMSPESASSSSLSSSESSSLEPKLYWLDEYGSSQCIQYGAHGHGANFLLSILDQGFSEEMTLEEAMELMKSCFQQLRTRYVINSPQPPCIKCVDANGIRLIR